MKEKMNADERTLVLKYVRLYPNYVKWYEKMRKTILLGNGEKPDSISRNRKKEGDPVLGKVLSLERLDRSHRAKVIRAIQRAGKYFSDQAQQKNQKGLKQAIWLSCMNGKLYRFETFQDSLSCSRRQFYRYKNDFLNQIKDSIGI